MPGDQRSDQRVSDLSHSRGLASQPGVDLDVERRWLMLAGVWVVYAAFGLTLGATAAFLPAIRADLDLSRSQMGVILGTWQFVYLAASLPSGKLIDRAGLRVSLGLAAAAIAASGVLRSVAGGFWSLLFAVAIFGIGGPLVSIGAPKMVAEVFGTVQRRTAVGIYGTGPAIGSAIGLAVSNSLVRPLLDDSWRATLALYAAFAVVAGAFWVAVSKPIGQVPPATDSALNSRALTRIPIVRFVLVIALGSFFFSHAISNWLVEMLESAGWSPIQAGYWASFPTLLGIAATLTLPRLATAERRIPILAGLLMLGGSGILFVLSSSALVLTPALVAVGLARSSIMPIAMLLLMDHPAVGPKNMALVGGLFFTAAEVGGVAGPTLTGVIADLTGGFGVPVVVLAAAMFSIAAFTVVGLRRTVEAGGSTLGGVEQ